MLKIKVAKKGNEEEGKYNEGYKWLDLPATEEEIQEALEEIDIDDEEYFIIDFESDFDGLKVSEYALNELNELIERYEYNLDTCEQDAVQAVIEAGYNFEKALDIVEGGRYTLYGDCESLADLASHLVEEGLFGDTSEMGLIVNYIDYEALGRDLRYDGYIETSKGVLIVD